MFWSAQAMCYDRRMATKPSRSAPLKIDLSFDEAMRRVVRVAPKPLAKRKAKAKKKGK
jgi:hypothetical protein